MPLRLMNQVPPMYQNYRPFPSLVYVLRYAAKYRRLAASRREYKAYSPVPLGEGSADAGL
jgi:hypothetical protein